MPTPIEPVSDLRLGPFVRAEIQELIEAKDFNSLREVFATWPPEDIASIFMDLPEEDEAVLFRILPRSLAAETFDFLKVEDQERLIQALSAEEVAGLLNSMSPDERTELLEELPVEATKRMLALLDPEKRAIAKTLLGYPENSVGRLMTTSYVSVRPEWTVAEALEYIRSHGQDSETLNVVYVVDKHGHLLDDLRIRKFLLSPLDTKISNLVDGVWKSLFAGDDRDKAIQMFRENDRVALPVTDSGGMLIGIVTIDDVLEVAEEKATEDIQKLGGSEALDEPYMDISFWQMIRKRAGWLVILFVGEMFTATAMGYFEDEIQKAAVLALFIPLIISSGGNSGSQASTLVIRAMALREISLRDWWRVVRREIFAGMSLGSILGVIGFARILLWTTFSNVYGPHWMRLAFTVSLSLIGVVTWGTLSGSVLPMILKRLGFDPATSSAPFVATLVDVTGLIIYFCIALLLLRGTLLPA